MVYILLANGFEEVEALTPLDYLRRCEDIEVKSAAVDRLMVTGAHHITVLADMHVDDIDPQTIEMLVLPGGVPGTLNLEASERVQELIDYCVQQEIYVAAICAAPSILGHRGLLDGRNATCYVGFDTQLGEARYTGTAVEQNGRFITARSAGTANQFAFHLIEVLLGKERAETLKAGILWE